MRSISTDPETYQGNVLQCELCPTLRACQQRQRSKEFGAVARVDPLLTDALVVESTRFRRHPHLLHRCLAVDDDFRAVVDELDVEHVAAASAFDVDQILVAEP